MKFGEKLECYAVTEWSDYYLRYKHLKKLIKRIRQEVDHHQTTSLSESPHHRLRLDKSSTTATSSGTNAPLLSEPLLVKNREAARGAEPAHPSDKTPVVVDSVLRAGLEGFDEELHLELQRIEEHFDAQRFLLMDRLNAIEQEFNDFEESTLGGRRQDDVQEQGMVQSSSFWSRGRPPTYRSSSKISFLQPGQRGTDEVQRGSYRTTTDGIIPKDRKTTTTTTLLPDYHTSPSHQNDINLVSINNNITVFKQPSQGGTGGGGDAGVESRSRLLGDGWLLDSPYSSSTRLFTKDQNAYMKRVQKVLLLLWEAVDKLESYVKLNVMALYKILKKRDKVLKIHLMMTDLKIYKHFFSKMIIGEDIKNQLLQLYRRTTTDKSEDVTLKDLQAVVQKDLMKMAQPNYGWLGYFLGVCSVLVVDIVVICLLPPTNPAYDTLQLLALFPMFRIVLMGVILMWASGLSMSLMERFGVNYRFMLEVDPKCQITASTVFTVAALQTVLWIALMGIYVVDYKFFGFGSNYVSSDYCWIYPTLLLLLYLVILFWPSRTIRYRYRRNLFEVLLLVLSAGCFRVKEITLVQNVFGDVLTSFAHPLGDLEYTVCFYSRGLPPKWTSPARCDWVENWLRPLIFAFPFYLRLCQCIIRYKRDRTKEKLTRKEQNIKMKKAKNSISTAAATEDGMSSHHSNSNSTTTSTCNIDDNVSASGNSSLAEVITTDLSSATRTAELSHVSVSPLSPHLSLPSSTMVPSSSSYSTSSFSSSSASSFSFSPSSARSPLRMSPRIHLLNAGKYLSGLAVVLCAALPWQSLLGLGEWQSKLPWICAYVVATIYMFLWDIYIDWNFMYPLFPSVRGSSGRLMYPKYLYNVVSITNLLGRSTWAMTLMPIELLANKQLNAALIALVVSIIEILRRSAWLVLRLENEHLTNSSRYRSMLWVPRLNVEEETPNQPK